MAPIQPPLYSLLREQESILYARQPSIFIFLSRPSSLSGKDLENGSDIVLSLCYDIGVD